MANEIKNFRAALAQNDRNKPMYSFLIGEIIFWSFVVGLAIGYQFDSDAVTIMSAIGFMVLFSVLICHPDGRILVFIFFGVGWATPFFALGYFLGLGVFFVAGIIAFIMSFVIHNWGVTYLMDLSRKDED